MKHIENLLKREKKISVTSLSKNYTISKYTFSGLYDKHVKELNNRLDKGFRT